MVFGTMQGQGRIMEEDKRITSTLKEEDKRDPTSALEEEVEHDPASVLEEEDGDDL